MSFRAGRFIVIAAAIGAFAASAAVADGPKGTASIKGKVVYSGEAPKAKALPMSGDAHCAKQGKQADQGTIIYAKDGNTVPYVFVYVKKGITGKYDVPTNPIVLDQKGCMYHPHVLGMIAGQPLKISNSDPTNHNIHSLAKKNPQFNFAQSNQGMERVLKDKDTFTRPEVMVKVKCDVHTWMSSYVGVMEHPFFDVTVSHENDGGDKAKRGTFTIKDLPAGEYEVCAWHESFGEVCQSVKVGDGEAKEIEFKFGAKSAAAPPAVREVSLGSVQGEGETIDIDVDQIRPCCGGEKPASQAGAAKKAS